MFTVTCDAIEETLRLCADYMPTFIPLLRIVVLVLYVAMWSASMVNQRTLVMSFLAMTVRSSSASVMAA